MPGMKDSDPKLPELAHLDQGSESDLTKAVDIQVENDLHPSPAHSHSSLQSEQEDVHVNTMEENVDYHDDNDMAATTRSLPSLNLLNLDVKVTSSATFDPKVVITGVNHDEETTGEQFKEMAINGNIPETELSGCYFGHSGSSLDRASMEPVLGRSLNNGLEHVTEAGDSEMESKRFEVSASPVVPRAAQPLHETVMRINSIKSDRSGSSSGVPNFQDSQMSVNSAATYHGTPLNFSRSSLRVNIIAEAAAIIPSFTSTFSLSEEPSDILRKRMTAGLPTNNIEFTEYEKSTSYQDVLDVLDNPAYTDTVKSTDSTASFLRRSMSVPGQYAYKKPETQRRHAREIFEDFFMSKSSIPEKDEEDFREYNALDLEHPDYTDSVQSTSSGAVLLRKQAIILSHDGKKPSLQSIQESVTIPIDPKQCKKNLLVLSVSCLLVFAAYMALRNLQSSIIPDSRLALYTLSSVYSSMFIGCIFAPSIILRLRPRATMMLGFVAVLIYISANFYPHYYTLIPSASLVGFAMSSVWTANSTYILNIAAAYSESTGKLLSVCYARFNSFFYMFFFLSQIIGGIIASSVLMLGMPSEHVMQHPDGNLSETLTNYSTVIPVMYTTEAELLTGHVGKLGNEPSDIYNTNGDMYVNENNVSIANYTHLINASNLTIQALRVETICGSKYCSTLSKRAVGPVSSHILYVLLTVYCVFIILGLVIMGLWLDPLEGEMHKTHKTIGQQLGSVFKWFIDRRVMLLLPLMLYTMVEMSFMFGEFTKAFITCPFGVQLVGYGMVCLSCCSSMSSYINGKLVVILGRTIVFTAAGMLHVSLVVSLLFWEPKQVGVMFLITGLWGIADAIWFTQVIGLLGLLFSHNRESAFAGFKMVQALGATTNLMSAQFVCTATKLYIVIGLLALAMVGYYVLEFELRQNEMVLKKSVDSICVDVKDKDPDTVSV